MTPPVTHTNESDARERGRSDPSLSATSRHHVINIIDVMTDGTSRGRPPIDRQTGLSPYINSAQFRAVCSHRRSS